VAEHPLHHFGIRARRDRQRRGGVAQPARRHTRESLVGLLAPFDRTGQPRLIRRWCEVLAVTRRPDQFVAILVRARRRQLVDHERR